METKRLFLAVPPTAATRVGLTEYQAELRKKPFFVAHQRICRWLHPDTLHLTLHYLGDVDSTQITGLIEVLAARLAAHAPGCHTQPLDTLLAFPDASRARVLGLGARPMEVVRELSLLWELMAQVLVGFNLPVEKRVFVPHISLVRFHQSLKMGKMGTEAMKFLIPNSLQYPVERVILFESHLTPEGAKYASLAEFLLAHAP